ncbi:MAG TPA: GNAT family protein [Flavobacteriaceae bacterium]|nr:GNAT family protein [Flavobacteriaceae bacterium]
MLTGKKIKLRALEPEDLEFLYQIENDTNLWEVSHTQTPYSKYILKNYLENSHRDIYEVKQLRLTITDLENKLVGLIDLFDFDPKNQRVGLGIVIASSENRLKGYATEAITLVCKYAFKQLNANQLYANISAENAKSVHLFEKLGFEKTGVKKEWNFNNGKFQDELLYQYFKK